MMNTLNERSHRRRRKHKQKVTTLQQARSFLASCYRGEVDLETPDHQERWIDSERLVKAHEEKKQHIMRGEKEEDDDDDEDEDDGDKEAAHGVQDVRKSRPLRETRYERAVRLEEEHAELHRRYEGARAFLKGLSDSWTDESIHPHDLLRQEAKALRVIMHYEKMEALRAKKVKNRQERVRRDAVHQEKMEKNPRQQDVREGEKLHKQRGTNDHAAAFHSLRIE
jgi:hypothetical protein